MHYLFRQFVSVVVRLAVSLWYLWASGHCTGNSIGSNWWQLGQRQGRLELQKQVASQASMTVAVASGLAMTVAAATLTVTLAGAIGIYTDIISSSFDTGCSNIDIGGINHLHWLAAAALTLVAATLTLAATTICIVWQL